MAHQATITRLNPEFIRTNNRRPLHFKNRRRAPDHRLPFVGRREGTKRGMHHWSVPETGGYFGGCETGKMLAQMYLKHLRAAGDDLDRCLQITVLDMLGLPFSGDEATESLRGQIVGFFSELDIWLEASAKHLGRNLDNLDPAALLKAANQGLNFDSEAYMAALEAQDEE